MRATIPVSYTHLDVYKRQIVSIPGGEPLLHKEMGEIVAGIVARKKFVYLCTNALLLEKKMDLFKPSPYLTFSIHLDGLKQEHDKSVCQDGVFDRCVSAIKEAKKRGFRVNVNCTLFNNANPERVVAFFDWCKQEKIDGITVSPGYAYERAPDQGHFLNRLQTKELFRNVLKDSKKKKWDFSQSMMFLDFLAGNQSYHCTPWSNPTRNVFGWQRPCYLLGEGYAESFKELMTTTNWDSYGTGNYEKCADCMVHCGYEGSAINDTLDNPLKVMKVKLFGIKTKGKMAKEIDLSKQRKADWIFDKQVENFLSDVHLATPTKSKATESKVRAKEPSNIV